MASRWLPIAALAVALALTGCDDASPRPEQPPSPAAPDHAAVVECPDAPPIGSAPPSLPDPGLPDEVPAGATSARLCAGEDEYGVTTVPRDALTTRVSALVRAVNRQPQVKRPRHCPGSEAPGFRVAFGYPDGSRFVATGRLSRCGALVVGDTWRLDSLPSVRTFVRLLRAQRSATEPPGSTVDPHQLTCDRPYWPNWTWPLARPVDLTTALLCRGDPYHPGKARRIVVPRAALAVLVSSMRRDTVSTYGALGCVSFGEPENWIVGESAWDDPILVTRGCGALGLGNSRDWSPHGRALRLLHRLTAAAR